MIRAGGSCETRSDKHVNHVQNRSVKDERTHDDSPVMLMILNIIQVHMEENITHEKEPP
jgi:hypothetical protein